MRTLTPHRRVSGSPSPRPPVSSSPRPISRTDTLAELRAIYRLLHTGDIDTAKLRLTTLGQNLQA